jgi:hypothetical protein
MGVGARGIRCSWPVYAFATAAWLACQSQGALAQFPRPEPMTGIGIDYGEPKKDAHKRIHDRLVQRKALEEYREFMSPLKLDQRLSVRLKECNDLNAYYNSGDTSITYCYELPAYLETIIAQYDVLPGFQKEDAVVASFVAVLLHETGHAIFNMLNIPVFGREEDAADAISSYAMLEVGKGSARRLLAGTAHMWRAWELDERKGGVAKFESFSDEHGTNAQRFYNALCIAHGSDEVLNTHVFDDLAGLLPQRPDGGGRRGKCKKEYLQVKLAFDKLVRPHINGEALKKVQEKEWILTGDGKDILPPPK